MSKQTPLHSEHTNAGGKMVDFAGYSMPVQYKDGMIVEHNWVRNKCGLFDVSHMGQVIFRGSDLVKLFSYITPSDFSNLGDSKAKYTVLLNKEGGIIDDLIITKFSENEFYAVLNASRKEIDMDYITAVIQEKGWDISSTYLGDRSLIAVQGPKAESVIESLIGDVVRSFEYMNAYKVQTKQGFNVIISRTGYTGEDGFEISAEQGVEVWQFLNSNEFAMPIGLGARDSLRLEMGYPLYGNDLNEDTSPIEAALSWVVRKTEQDFIGNERILDEKENGVKHRRVGIKLIDKGIARAGAKIFAEDKETEIGFLSSGGFSPTLQHSIGQAYIKKGFSKKGNKVYLEVRGKMIESEIHSFIFHKVGN